MMDWRRLLSTQRSGHPAPEPSAPDRSAFQKDWDRVVFSSAFRRLQDKTQVHSLPDSDYVRTRLTHSMEVSAVGRSLGAAIGHVVLQRWPRLNETMAAADFGHIVSAACLAHDIGNPPFGHFGEATIRQWFRDPRSGGRFLTGLTPAERADLEGFEGNAQGFRILTRLQNWRDEGGLRLTAATLATFTKYPRESLVEPDPANDAGGVKFGVFQAEAAIFGEVADAVGLLRRTTTDGAAWCRHPLAFLVEAADDICYRIVDLEDGCKLGRIRFEEAESLLLSVIGGSPPRYRDIEDAPRRIGYLRAKAIGRLIDAAASVFLDREAEIMAGTMRRDLLSQTDLAGVLDRIAALTAERIFETPDRYRLEIGGVDILTTLLATFTEAVEAAAEMPPEALAPRQRELLGMLPEPVRPAGRYPRLLQVTDFVSGMTDTYAVSQYRRLTGPVPA